jgi:hypothetical protein
MKTNALKVSMILLVIVYGIGTILSLILIFNPTFFIASQFELATGQKLSDFAESNPLAHSYHLLTELEIGIFMFGLMIVTLLITFFAYRKEYKWSWYIILISVTLIASASVGANIPTGDMKVVIMAAILSGLAYVGLAIGAKAVLKKASS